MKTWLRACLLARALAMPAARGAEPGQDDAGAAHGEAALAAHYYLQGVMETGSELRLATDGRFQERGRYVAH